MKNPTCSLYEVVSGSDGLGYDVIRGGLRTLPVAHFVSASDADLFAAIRNEATVKYGSDAVESIRYMLIDQNDTTALPTGPNLKKTNQQRAAE